MIYEGMSNGRKKWPPAMICVIVIQSKKRRNLDTFDSNANHKIVRFVSREKFLVKK